MTNSTYVANFGIAHNPNGNTKEFATVVYMVDDRGWYEVDMLTNEKANELFYECCRIGYEKEKVDKVLNDYGFIKS